MQAVAWPSSAVELIANHIRGLLSGYNKGNWVISTSLFCRSFLYEINGKGRWNLANRCKLDIHSFPADETGGQLWSMMHFSLKPVNFFGTFGGEWIQERLGCFDWFVFCLAWSHHLGFCSFCTDSAVRISATFSSSFQLTVQTSSLKGAAIAWCQRLKCYEFGNLPPFLEETFLLFPGHLPGMLCF